MPGKRKRCVWNDEDMVLAMEDVKRGKMSVNAASKLHNVPRKTLDDRIRGRVRHGAKPGPSTILSLDEEKALTSYLVYMAQRGFPLTRTMVKAFAWAIAKRSGNGDRFSTENRPGEHWWQNFKKRHPKLSLRQTDSLDRSRAEALSIVFWVDCDKCGCWVHNYCAFNKKNDVTCGYVLKLHIA